MAKEQDVFQLPVRYIDYENIEEMALAVQRNFKELERQLAILQLAVKKATGGGIKDLPYKASIWDRAEAINEDGTIPAKMLDDKLVGLEHELQLADEAVTEAKIAVGAVTNKKLAIDAVTAEKIAEAAVTAQKLAQEAVTEEKIAGEAITAEKIKAGAIGAAALAAGAVTTDKLDAQAVTAGKIAAGAVTAEKIQAGSITSQHINADGITANLITSGELLTAKVTVASQDGYTKFRGDGITVQDRTGATRIALGRVDELGQQTATFTRNSEAYTSDGQKVAVNQPRFEPGKFGQAVLVEEGTTNVFGNSGRLDTDSNGDGLADNVVIYTLISSYSMVTDSWLGTKSQRAVSSGSGAPRLQYNIAQAVSTGQVWSVSIYGKAQAGKTLYFVVKNQADGTVAAKTQPATGGWDLITLTFTIPSDVTSIKVQFGLANAVAGDWFQYCALQLEQKPYPTSFTDNTRAVERLRIPTAGVLDPTEGTISFFVKPNIVTNWNNFCNIGVTNGRFLLYFNENGDALFDYGTANQGVRAPNTIKEGVWQHIAIRWSASTNKQAIFVNGVKYEKDLANGVSDSFSSDMNVVVNYSALIDDLRISSIARSDEEIKQAYESNQPLQWDQYTTYLLRFDGNLQPVIGHEHSLKMSHGSGEYTKVGDRGLERFVPKPIYSTTPTGVPNTQNFEGGAIPSGWETSGASIDSSVRYAGNYSLRITSGNGKTFARTFQEITKDNTTVSFYYLASGTGPAYTFWVDGQAYELTADGTWRQLTVNVNKGIHMFQWEVYRRYVDSGSGTLNIDNVVFEQNPVEEVLSGYSEEGYTYNYRTYVGTAATVGSYNFPGEWNIPQTMIPDIWIQLPQDFVGKDFEVFLSLKNIATPLSDVTIQHTSLELLEKDTAKGRFKVRANVVGFTRMYSLMALLNNYYLTETRTRTMSGVQFTYFATY